MLKQRKIEKESEFWRCEQLFDSEKGVFIEDQVLEIQNGIILSLKPFSLFKGPPPQELKGYVLPGLIDSHVHPLIWEDDYQINHLKHSSAFKALKGLSVVQQMLQCGWTTIRIAGDADVHFAPLDLKRAIDQGIFVGPRIFAAGHYLSVTGGAGDLQQISCEQSCISDGKIVNGCLEMLKAVREEIKAGSSWIKILVSGGYMSAFDSPLCTHMNFEEIETAVKEASRWNIPVMAHCHSSESIKLSIKAGVRSIEHSTFIDEEGLEMAIDQKVFIVPTLLVGKMIQKKDSISMEKMNRLQESLQEKERECMERIVKNPKVQICVGTDYVGVWDVKENVKELECLEELGMDRVRILQSATLTPGKMLREKIGVLKEGYFADFIVIDKNPLEDLKALSQISFVFKSGNLISKME